VRGRGLSRSTQALTGAPIDVNLTKRLLKGSVDKARFENLLALADPVSGWNGFRYRDAMNRERCSWRLNAALPHLLQTLEKKRFQVGGEDGRLRIED
jgi:hypothetical protein